jgi:hypothetical protein
MEGFYTTNGSLDVLFGASLLHRYFFEAYESAFDAMIGWKDSRKGHVIKIDDTNLFGNKGSDLDHK